VLRVPHLILTSMRDPIELHDPLLNLEANDVDGLGVGGVADLFPLYVVSGLEIILNLRASLVASRREEMVERELEVFPAGILVLASAPDLRELAVLVKLLWHRKPLVAVEQAIRRVAHATRIGDFVHHVDEELSEELGNGCVDAFFIFRVVVNV